jgi:hypothetical protein
MRRCNRCKLINTPVISSSFPYMSLLHQQLQSVSFRNEILTLVAFCEAWTSSNGLYQKVEYPYTCTYLPSALCINILDQLWHNFDPEFTRIFQIEITTNLFMLSKVSSSLNNFAKPKISSLDTRSPFLTWLKFDVNYTRTEEMNS